MKTKFIFLLLLAILFYQTAALAETLTGVVINVDPPTQEINLRRDDTQQVVIIRIKDASTLANVMKGDQISVNANQKTTGEWEAQAIEPPADNANNKDTSINTAVARDSREVTRDLKSNLIPYVTPYNALTNTNSDASATGSITVSEKNESTSTAAGMVPNAT